MAKTCSWGLASKTCPAPQKRSFLNLPPELRNKIYDLYLAIPDSFNIGPQNYPDSLPQTTNLSLLRTSHQIHDEATPILYGTPTFCLSSLLDLKNWLSQMNSSATFLRKIEISYPSNADLILCLLQLQTLPAAATLSQVILKASVGTLRYGSITWPAPQLLRGGKGEIAEYLRACVGKGCGCRVHWEEWNRVEGRARRAFEEDMSGKVSSIERKKKKKNKGKSEW